MGIVYDRVGDTLFQDLEQHRQLHFALKGVEKSKIGDKDPFEEATYRLEILHKGSAVSEYTDYLRSRMRLTRALATLLPGLAVAWLVGQSPRCDGSLCSWQLLAIGWVGGIYGFLFIWKLAGLPYRPPKTNARKEKLEKYSEMFGLGNVSPGRVKSLGRGLAPAFGEILTWGLVGLALLAVWVGYQCGHQHPWRLPLLATGITLVTTWA